MGVLLFLAFISSHVILLTDCLDNGLALTPPMGWLTWERFRCNIDCKDDPENCISEHLIKVMVNRLVADGYLAAGYQYITVDDCWLEVDRDKNGKLQPDNERFPSGMKALAEYVHSRGLRFGIYEDFGVKTCAGYPGSEFHMMMDAQTFADWGVDLLKFDGCNSDYNDDKYGYPAMAFFLKKAGRPIVYSCEWPLQYKIHHATANYTAVSEACNLWRNYDDVGDSWDSIRNIIAYYGEDKGNFSKAAKPGAWNDPDMLVIGNYGLSPTQERAQMAMWAIFAAPLIMSVDLRNIRQDSKDLLLNKRVIAVNQDKLGIAGQRIIQDKNLQVWVRPLSQEGAAVVYLNLNNGGGPSKVAYSLAKLGLIHDKGYNITETFEGKYLGQYKPSDYFSCLVDPSGVYMITATAL